MVTLSRVSHYGQEIEGVLDFYPNPAQTIPTLPGLIYTIKRNNDNHQFLIGNNTGYLYFVEDDSIEISGNTYSFGDNINARGVLSQRWDFLGKTYADIWITEANPVSIESVQAKDFLSFERNNEQITVHSTQGIKKIFAYDTSGRLIFQNSYSTVVGSATFSFLLKQNIVISVETGNGKRLSQVVQI